MLRDGLMPFCGRATGPSQDRQLEPSKRDQKEELLTA
jgi:hypothetical protein